LIDENKFLGSLVDGCLLQVAKERMNGCADLLRRALLLCLLMGYASVPFPLAPWAYLMLRFYFLLSLLFSLQSLNKQANKNVMAQTAVNRFLSFFLFSPFPFLFVPVSCCSFIQQITMSKSQDSRKKSALLFSGAPVVSVWFVWLLP